MEKKKTRKKYKKYESKYYSEFGYSIKDVCEILGWSYGTVHAYFNDDEKREMMLGLVEAENENNDGVSEDDYRSQNPRERVIE